MSYGKLNCAGQECPDRDTCRRYVVRVATSAGKDQPQVVEWASFDIERMNYKTCPHYIQKKTMEVA